MRVEIAQSWVGACLEKAAAAIQELEQQNEAAHEEKAAAAKPFRARSAAFSRPSADMAAMLAGGAFGAGAERRVPMGASAGEQLDSSPGVVYSVSSIANLASSPLRVGGSRLTRVGGG